LIFVVVIFGSVNFGICANNEGSIEEQLRNVANETRKSLPMMMNPDVQATSIGAVGKVLVSKYNFTTSKSSMEDLKEIQEYYYKNSINGACSNQDIISVMKNGVSLMYEYYDSDNVFIMKYTIDKNTCRNI
jgi:Cu/Ag efflux pump CusA